MWQHQYLMTLVAPDWGWFTMSMAFTTPHWCQTLNSSHNTHCDLSVSSQMASGCSTDGPFTVITNGQWPSQCDELSILLAY